MKSLNVLIVTGGHSSERPISLISAQAVFDALRYQNRHNAQIFDLKKGIKKLLEISKDFDVIFPVLHGEEGEGGGLQKILFQNHIPYVGGDWKGFKEGWYKIPFKKYCDKHNVKTSNWKIITNLSDIEKFGFPCVLKASIGGSSKEVVILKSAKNLIRADLLIKKVKLLFVEKYLSGIEVTVPILNNQRLPVLEIIPPKGSWFSYKNKYSPKTKETINAPSLTKKMRRDVQQIALKIHKDLNLGSMSRTDFIISGNQPYALEVNTIPGLTPNSLFPKAAKAAGINFPDLVDLLVRLALKNVRHN